MRTVEDVAREVDVMGGIGHISGFTEQAQARRRAADVIRAQAEVIEQLRVNPVVTVENFTETYRRLYPQSVPIPPHQLRAVLAVLAAEVSPSGE